MDEVGMQVQGGRLGKGTGWEGSAGMQRRAKCNL